MAKKLMVVGDNFLEFSKGKDVITVSQLELITQIPANIIDEEKEFYPGQGIRNDFLKKIVQNQVRNNFYGNKIDLTELKKYLNCNQKNAHAHKHNKDNILIGTCHRLNENLFSLPLFIDERCELMSDHQTGQHIQGMIQIEACRQTFIAVTEEFYLHQQKHESYYVINNMNTCFSNFLFPLPASVHYELLEQDINERRARFKSDIRIIQNNSVCSSMSVGFTVYPSDVIKTKESCMANDTTRHILNSIQKSLKTEQLTAHRAEY